SCWLAWLAAPWLLLPLVRLHKFSQPYCSQRATESIPRINRWTVKEVEQRSLITDVGKLVSGLENGLGVTALEDAQDGLLGGTLTKVRNFPCLPSATHVSYFPLRDTWKVARVKVEVKLTYADSSRTRWASPLRRSCWAC